MSLDACAQIAAAALDAGIAPIARVPNGQYSIATRALDEKLWLWPLSTAYAGAPGAQGFILGFGSTRAEDMAKSARQLRRLVESESGYKRRKRSGY